MEENEVCFNWLVERLLIFIMDGIDWSQTSVLCVWIRTFLTLPFRESVGDVPENPGFCMPSPSFCRGFFKLDLNGDLVTEEAAVDPLDEAVVNVVFIDAILPLTAAAD